MNGQSGELPRQPFGQSFDCGTFTGKVSQQDQSDAPRPSFQQRMEPSFACYQHITAQLIRSSDGFHIWSETYDRKLEGGLLRAAIVTAAGARAANSFPERDVVIERPFGAATCASGAIEARLPGLSFVHLQLPATPV